MSIYFKVKQAFRFEARGVLVIAGKFVESHATVKPNMLVTIPLNSGKVEIPLQSVEYVACEGVAYPGLVFDSGRLSEWASGTVENTILEIHEN